MEIKIKYHTDIDKIVKLQFGDWIDLRAAEDVWIEYDQYKHIPLGVSMELPPGYEAHIVPRSSTFKKFGIIMTNSVGIIDFYYRGDGDEWQFPAFCIDPKEKRNAVRGSFIPKNTRICQFRIVQQQPKIEFREVESLGHVDRGGFGSTGD